MAASLVRAAPADTKPAAGMGDVLLDQMILVMDRLAKPWASIWRAFDAKMAGELLSFKIVVHSVTSS